MIRKFLGLFAKGDHDRSMAAPKDTVAKFYLSVDDIKIGELKCEKGEWTFKYSSEFKEFGEEYNTITGFPDINRVYRSEELWPFFRIRIPGLKQPAVQEVIAKEKIDSANEVELLKHFGKKTISNPYELEFA